MTQRYIHITNWDTHQHRDVTRNKAAAARWIKDKPSQLNDEEYLGLGLAERGLLKDIRLQYAANRGRGIIDSTANLTRVLGTRVYRSQVERLNQAGFIEFSDSKSPENRQPRLEENRLEEKNLATASREDLSTGSLFAPDQATNGAVPDSPFVGADELEPDANADIILPLNGRHLELVAPPDISARPRDDIWDLLEVKFGPVGSRGNKHAKRNTAVADLRDAGATVELIQAACDRWPAVFPSATLTDVALATHYPLLAVPLLAKASRPAPCAECELGGGAHAVGCSRAVA